MGIRNESERKGWTNFVKRGSLAGANSKTIILLAIQLGATSLSCAWSSKIVLRARKKETLLRVPRCCPVCQINSWVEPDIVLSLFWSCRRIVINRNWTFRLQNIACFITRVQNIEAVMRRTQYWYRLMNLLPD